MTNGQLKIAFTGASGSGKTYLIKKLYERFKSGVPTGLIEEMVEYTLLKMEAMFDEKLTVADLHKDPRKYEVFQYELWTAKSVAESIMSTSEARLVLIDRPITDHFLYTITWGSFELWKRFVIWNRVADIQDYDKIIHLAPLPVKEYDGKRDKDIPFADFHDTMLGNWYRNHPGYIYVAEQIFEDRIRIIEETIWRWINEEGVGSNMALGSNTHRTN